jgi:hypothetical protein
MSNIVQSTSKKKKKCVKVGHYYLLRLTQVAWRTYITDVSKKCTPSVFSAKEESLNLLHATRRHEPEGNTIHSVNGESRKFYKKDRYFGCRVSFRTIRGTYVIFGYLDSAGIRKIFELAITA